MPTQPERVREKHNYNCPLCQADNRSSGWLRWHLANKHPGYKAEPSSAPAMTTLQIADPMVERFRVTEAGREFLRRTGYGHRLTDGTSGGMVAPERGE